MNIVVDTNVFISALIKEGITRFIIVNSKDNLLLPEFELEEIYNHKKEIMIKAKLSEKDYDIILLRLLKYVRIISSDLIINKRDDAFKIIGKVDPDDVIFFATALTFNAFIWSDDKHFKMQERVKILTTKEIISVFN
ncbi:MAG: PIN domain-containing protein [Nanoarchaeota archaeon]